MDENFSATAGRRRLPSLAALHSFEAAARHQSVKRAAAELTVTPTAVSHQIRRLEAELGVPLFERRPRRIRTTPAGDRLFPVLRDGFDAFAGALRAIAAPTEPRVLTLTATTAFVARWLLPRIGSLRAACPGLDLRLHASDDPVDLREGGVDVAIRYGRGPHPGLVATHLAEDVFFPVASPRLRLRAPKDLRGKTLIHFEWRRRDRRTPTWERWLRRAGLGGLETRALVFNDESHAIVAAIAGDGVALLSSFLVEAELTQGALVRPFRPSLPGYRYAFVRPPEADRLASVTALGRWLAEEIASR